MQRVWIRPKDNRMFVTDNNGWRWVNRRESTPWHASYEAWLETAHLFDHKELKFSSYINHLNQITNK